MPTVNEMKTPFNPDAYARTKVVTMGHITELITCQKPTLGGSPCRKIDKDHYEDMRTGELKEYKHIQNRSESLKSIRHTLERIRALINSNVTEPENVRWVTLTYAENMTWNLLVPADKIENISEAASMIHMMNANTFTCGVFKISNISAADFGAAMKDAVLNNQWMCGFPEQLLIRSFGDSYVLVAFGINDAMTPFEKHLTEAYPGMETIASEPIV